MVPVQIEEKLQPDKFMSSYMDISREEFLWPKLGPKLQAILCGLIPCFHSHTQETNFNLKTSDIISICLKARKACSHLSL